MSEQKTSFLMQLVQQIARLLDIQDLTDLDAEDWFSEFKQAIAGLKIGNDNCKYYLNRVSALEEIIWSIAADVDVILLDSEVGDPETTRNIRQAIAEIKQWHPAKLAPEFGPIWAGDRDGKPIVHNLLLQGSFTMTDKLNLSPEPTHVRSDCASMHDLLIADIQERKDFGPHKYGTPPQAFNERKVLTDAYQEQMDRLLYLRQKIEEEANTIQITPWKFAPAEYQSLVYFVRPDAWIVVIPDGIDMKIASNLFKNNYTHRFDLLSPSKQTILVFSNAE